MRTCHQEVSGVGEIVRRHQHGIDRDAHEYSEHYVTNAVHHQVRVGCCSVQKDQYGGDGDPNPVRRQPRNAADEYSCTRCDGQCSDGRKGHRRDGGHNNSEDDHTDLAGGHPHRVPHGVPDDEECSVRSEKCFRAMKDAVRDHPRDDYGDCAFQSCDQAYAFTSLNEGGMLENCLLLNLLRSSENSSEQDLVRCYRQIAYPHTGSIVDSIDNSGCCPPDDPDLAGAPRSHRVDVCVSLVEPEGLDVLHIRVCADVVARQVVSHHVAEPVVPEAFLVQSHRQSHRHSSNEL